LEIFPFVHSDETWLGGLSNAYMTQRSIYVTEPFFNLLPRFPHAIKSLFHGLQIIMISLFGYNILSLRLLSLFFAMATLIVLYQLLTKICSNRLYPFLITILFSLNIQFIYASHFARQEIILVFVILLAYSIYRYASFTSLKKALILGLILGLSILIHPNSFIVALSIGFIMLYDVINKKLSLKGLLSTVLTTAFFGLLVVLISFIGDSNFINHYLNYGSTLSVDNAFLTKLTNFDDFYIKLFNQIGGTYYLPNIKLFLVISALLIIGCLVYIIFKKPKGYCMDYILAVMGIQIGIIIIGRYNATSIILFFPFIYLLFAWLIDIIDLPHKWSLLIITPFIITSFGYDYHEVVKYSQSDYETYIENIKTALPENPVILGNLSGLYAYDDYPFYDIRNLTYLEDNNMTFEDYIKVYKINTIVFYEEQDYIYRNEKWEILYGDDDYYYEDFKAFLENNCTLVTSFYDPIYGMRITRYMQDYPWEIKIYTVNGS
jgi:dolichyl-phosphate-mannose--protein O-mannosyl transferase